MKKILLLILSLILIISCCACNKSENNNIEKNNDKEVTTRENLINENKFYKEGILENNNYINQSINLSIDIPKEYILFDKKDFKHLNSELTTYEVYGQTEDEKASISIISIQCDEKSSAIMYIETLKQKLKEQNNENKTKAQNIILESEGKVLTNKALYLLKTKKLINDEYYNQNYTCTDRNDKIFCVISTFKDEKSTLNEQLDENIKYIE